MLWILLSGLVSIPGKTVPQETANVYVYVPEENFPGETANGDISFTATTYNKEGISINFPDSDSIYNVESIFSTETVDTIEDNAAFDSIITEVGSLSSYSHLDYLSPYIYEWYKDMENYYLPYFYHKDKINQCILPLSQNKKIAKIWIKIQLL